MDSDCNSSYQNAEVAMEVEGIEGQSGNPQMDVLSLPLMERGLHTIGLNPNTLQFSFIGLDISGESLQNIDYIQKYPNLMNINLANNKVESLKALSALPMLTTLNAR